MKQVIVASLVVSLSGLTRPALARDLLVFGHEYHATVQAWWDPFFTCQSFCLSSVLVYARSDLGLRSVTFSAPAPACLNGPAVFQFQTPHTVTAGDISTGITVTFNDCLLTQKNSNGYPIQDIYVGVITIVTTSPIECCAYFPLPAAAYRRVEGTDCEGNTVVLNHQGVTFNFEEYASGCGVPSTPYGEFPMHGSEVPAGAVLLDWDCGTSAGTNLGEFRQGVWFGTDPDHLERVGYHVQPPYNVGPLDSGRAYYWRVSATTDFGGSVGPVWSFTTAPTTPVKPATWGKVKAMFRKSGN